MKVFIIPLADKGFIPTSERNRARWYIENEDNKVNLNFSFSTKEDAENFARKMGWVVMDS